jgi:4-hydroxy-tetrahydrodipicolinate synthase
MFKGSVVALVTPMQVNGQVDEPCLVDLVEWHIKEGTEGFVVAGTTGESATLSEAERLSLIQLVVKQVHKRVPVFAGTGTNATASTIAVTKEAKAAGADGALVVTPYYNRPTQDGLFQHFSALAQALDFPLMLYNVPARTACDLLPKTVGLLADAFPHIVGIKEATGDLHRLAELKERCPQDFLIMSGDDATAMEFMLQGAHGVISVLSNVLPKAMRALCTAALSEDSARAHVLNESLAHWYRKLGLEPNPIPVKWLLQKMGKIPPGIRLPLTPLSSVFHAMMLTLLEQEGVNYV